MQLCEPTIKPYKQRQVHEGQRVKCYRNLHGSDGSSFSVMLGSHVHGHTDTLLLRDARFNVRESGRQRVIREKHKNIHAFVTGTLADQSQAPDISDMSPAYYNPYKTDSFIDLATEEPIHHADIVLLHEGLIYYANKNNTEVTK